MTIPMETMPPKTPQAQATEALREAADQIRGASGPAEVAALVEEVIRDGGTLEALSDVIATASRWVADRPGGGHLWQPLGLAADEIWQAGADLTEVPAQLRALASHPALIRSAAVRSIAAASAAPSPAQPPPVPTARHTR
ncbi:hypothetical protein GCM10010430_60570 [Kitasatospora cystarginea]|uniref:Uncharacterized protein n=2 Tax=Kitasatospora cystarginea TaxID=58350 RepID=A0ABP5RQR2_9ACTN